MQILARLIPSVLEHGLSLVTGPEIRGVQQARQRALSNQVVNPEDLICWSLVSRRLLFKYVIPRNCIMVKNPEQTVDSAGSRNHHVHVCPL